MRSILASLFTIFLFSACSVGPDYVRPNAEMPQAWRVDAGDAAAVANVAWWEGFQDSELTQLIKIALEQNKDLKIATAAVEEFYARYGIERSKFFPQTSIGASYARVRNSTTAVFPDNGKIRDLYDTTANLSWELDIWGRIRRTNEAARANILAEESARRGVVLTIVSAVAETYVNLRELDEELAIAKRTLKTREEGFRIAKARFDAGLTSELDLKQSEAELAATQVTIPSIERQIAQTENALSILLGRNPGAIARGVPVQKLMLVKGVPQGIPSDILTQRPDVVRAEQTLIAANAQIGAVRAEYFPKLSLTSFFGYASVELSDWVKAPSRKWNVGPNLGFPLFNAGAIGNQVQAAKAVREQAVQGYLKTVQIALQEVEDALIGYRKIGEQRTAKSKEVTVLRRYLELAEASYKEGQTNYLDVLDAQRRLFSAELEFSQLEGAAAKSYITLFKALGGGWVVEAADKLSPVQPGNVSTLF